MLPASDSSALLGMRVGDTVDMPAGHTAVLQEIRELSAELGEWLTGHDL